MARKKRPPPPESWPQNLAKHKHEFFNASKAWEVHNPERIRHHLAYFALTQQRAPAGRSTRTDGAAPGDQGHALKLAEAPDGEELYAADFGGLPTTVEQDDDDVSANMSESPLSSVRESIVNSPRPESGSLSQHSRESSMGSDIKVVHRRHGGMNVVPSAAGSSEGSPTGDDGESAQHDSDGMDIDRPELDESGDDEAVVDAQALLAHSIAANVDELIHSRGADASLSHGDGSSSSGQVYVDARENMATDTEDDASGPEAASHVVYPEPDPLEADAQGLYTSEYTTRHPGISYRASANQTSEAHRAPVRGAELVAARTALAEARESDHHASGISSSHPAQVRQTSRGAGGVAPLQATRQRDTAPATSPPPTAQASNASTSPAAQVSPASRNADRGPPHPPGLARDRPRMTVAQPGGLHLAGMGGYRGRQPDTTRIRGGGVGSVLFSRDALTDPSDEDDEEL